MARKDVLAGISMPSVETAERNVTASTSYAMKGASKSMLSSIGELASQAAKAERLLEGASIVELDTEMVDVSFVSDRLDGGEEAYEELREAIRENGQNTPVLVRPHPKSAGKYMLVFGHRRLRVATELQRPIKAIIQDVSDEFHVIAQGQENSARDNLSFIEKAVFAQRLTNIGHTKETIQVALSTDAPMLVRMLSVTKRLPYELIHWIGSAKAIGRDRWIDFAVRYDKLPSHDVVKTMVDAATADNVDSNERFERLYEALKQFKPRKKGVRSHPDPKTWTAADKSIAASVQANRNAYTIKFSERDAKGFGEWLTKRLDRLHDDFQKAQEATGE